MSASLIQETFTFTETPAQEPAGTAVAKVIVTLTGQIPGNVVTLDVPLGATTDTASLQPDTYAWLIQNQDANGNTIGGPFTGSIVVAAPQPVTVNLVSSLAASP